MKYQSVPVPEDLIEAINEADSFSNKIQINHFGNNYCTAQDDHPNNNKDDDQTRSNDIDNYKGESYDELNNSQQLDCKESNTMFPDEKKVLLIVGSSKSTSVFVIKLTGISSTSTFLQGLFLQYLHEVKNIIVTPQLPLLVSLHDDVLHHLYEGIYMVVSLLTSLLASLRSEFLQSSLLASLKSEFLRLSLFTSLRSEFLQSYLLASLGSGFLRSSLLRSL